MELIIGKCVFAFLRVLLAQSMLSLRVCCQICIKWSDMHGIATCLLAMGLLQHSLQPIAQRLLGHTHLL